ncbi:MAG: hypothetical protein HY721_07570 [Planctomycetes bacterium]|nr:hypothetical protein [Planctomycetota bacterium]
MALACLAALAALGGEAPRAPTQHDALPILLGHCAACHGSVRPEADFDVRSRATLLRGGKSGPAIAPGKPEESVIVKKIRAGPCRSAGGCLCPDRGQGPPGQRLLRVPRSYRAGGKGVSPSVLAASQRGLS